MRPPEGIDKVNKCSQAMWASDPSQASIILGLILVFK